MDGWDLCAGLFYEHRFAMLIRCISERFELLMLETGEKPYIALSAF